MVQLLLMLLEHTLMVQQLEKYNYSFKTATAATTDPGFSALPPSALRSKSQNVLVNSCISVVMIFNVNIRII